MAIVNANHRAHLTDAEIERLEEDLIDAELQASSGISRGGSANVELSPSIRRELIGIYREGVDIASSIESYPLLKLLQEADQSVPPDIKVAAESHDFHLLSLVFSLRLPRDVRPSEAEFAVELSTVQPAANEEEPRVHAFFPPEVRDTILSLSTEAQVGITAGLNFAVPQQVKAIVPFADVSADAKVAAKFIAGPFRYELRRARILADGRGTPRVQWRYLMDSDLASSSEFPSWVVVKTLKGIDRLKVGASLGILPYRTEWALFKRSLKVLRDSLEVEVPLAHPSSPD